MMKAFCRRLCCAIFCCRCKKPNPLKVIDENTRLLPKSEKTKKLLEKNEIHSYGVVPENLRGAIIDVSNYSKSFVRKIVCGSNHCLILFNDGLLAGFGSNDEGQLGFKFKKDGNYYNELKLNKFIFTIQTPAGDKIINPGEYEIWDISAGDNFSLILVRVNLMCYLIKFGISTEDKYSNEIEMISTVNIIDIDHEKIGQISNIYVFGQRSMLLTTNNDLYVGGIDFNLNPINKFKHVERFATKVKSVHLGQEHCLILDCDNTYGETGIEDLATAEKFTKVNLSLPGTIKKISTGARHSLVLLDNGNLYAFGDNSEGQCAGALSRYAYPVKIEVESREKIIDIYSGYNHNLVVMRNGEMFTWGDTSSGKLTYIEGNLSQVTPRLVQVLKGKFPNYVCLGFQMTVMSTSSFENSLVNSAKNY